MSGRARISLAMIRNNLYNGRFAASRSAWRGKRERYTTNNHWHILNDA
jgi:hypothetical protein